MDNMIREYYEDLTQLLTLQEIADKVGTTYGYVQAYVSTNYPEELRKLRKSLTYQRSKLGINNPMLGKTGTDHHNFKGEVRDGKGYLITLKPDWYTGRKGSKHVFVHHVVMCELLGLTELPAGFVVHHIDHNPLNNKPSNLALMTKEAHSHLHQLERATTRRKP